MKNFTKLFVLFSFLFLWSACEKDPLGFLNNDLVFDMDLYEQNIQDALDDQTMGYAYTINKDGQMDRHGAAGLARTASDPPLTLQAYDKPMHVASVSKTITTVAVMRLLEEKGLTINEKITTYLPSDWARGPGVNDLTFQDLLSHKSGLGWDLIGSPSYFDSLKAVIADGVVNPPDYVYSNGHFALFRVIIPYLWEITPWTGGASLEQALADIYIYYVREEILKPIGIENAKVTGLENDATLYYSFPESNSGGAGNNLDFTLTCGGFGWHLSSFDLANFLAHMYYDNDFLKAYQREQMEDHEMGWFGNDGDHGTYYSHTGRWTYSNPAPTRGLRTCIIHFPNGVQTALLINSRGGVGSPSILLREAFDNAWVEK